MWKQNCTSIREVFNKYSCGSAGTFLQYKNNDIEFVLITSVHKNWLEEGDLGGTAEDCDKARGVVGDSTCSHSSINRGRRESGIQLGDHISKL